MRGRIGWALLCVCMMHGTLAWCRDYRPAYHYTTPRNWMNEPNGLVYVGGLWHMFYQTNPEGITFANLSWGHAVSDDLINWRYKGIAIPYEDSVLSYSGTVAFDKENMTGLGRDGRPPFLAYYTGCHSESGEQDQRLAFSLDRGKTWTKYKLNPVISTSQEAPFDITRGKETRDPKVFYHEDSRRWVMLLAHGGQNKLSLWISDDGLSWKWSSDIAAADFTWLPSNVTGWEVPDLFPMRDPESAQQVWCLLVTPARGSPAGGNGVFGVIGDFNGRRFKARHDALSMQWLDYGRDFDGVTSWENVPNTDGRRIIAGIMNSYGGNIPTRNWKGMISIPRELTLRQTGGKLQLLQQPVRELRSIGKTVYTLENTVVKPDEQLQPSVGGNALDIEIECIPERDARLVIHVRASDNEATIISYNSETQTLAVDRNSSGNNGYHSRAGGIHSCTLKPDMDGVVAIRLLVDECSLEVFGGDGEAVISNLIFPKPSSSGVRLFCEKAGILIKKLEMRNLLR